MLDGRWRSGVERGLGPVGAALRRLGLSADVFTVFGLLASFATAWLAATGRFGWAVVGIVAAGVGDLLDGAVARGSGQTGPRGAFFDSVADRVSDAVLLGGVAWWFAGSDRPHLSVLAFAVAATSMVISYERAKAEALGLTARGGLMERAERFVLLGVAFAFDLLVPVLWVMLALTLFTALERFRRVWVQAGRPPRPAVHARARRSGGALARGGASRRRVWWTGRPPAGDRRRPPRVPRRPRP